MFGEQPDTAFVNRLGRKGLLTTDTIFNFQNQASYNQIINIAAQIQPVRDLNITVSVSKSFGKNYTELYKDTTREYICPIESVYAGLQYQFYFR